jgi:L-iditol 2-dehydrogenase
MRTQRAAFLLGPEQIEIRSVPIDEPEVGEILVRIEAATTCGTDVKVFLRGGHPRMLVVPTPFGHEMAGRVEAVGEGVERWKAGDRVVVANSASCGACPACQRGQENLCRDLHYLNGAFAEYIIVPPRFVKRSTYAVPDHLSFETAAIAEPLACVVHGHDLIRNGIREVLVVGAGPIGLLFADLLTSEGHRVTVADPNRSRLDVARAIGAAGVVEVPRGQAEVEAVLREHRGGYDAVIEATGTPSGWRNAIDCVRPGGEIVLFGGCAPGTTVPLDTHRTHYSELTIRGAYHHRPVTFAKAIELLGAGRLHPAELLSSRAGIEDVEDALRSMMRKEALKVVIRG